LERWAFEEAIWEAWGKILRDGNERRESNHRASRVLHKNKGLKNHSYHRYSFLFYHTQC
jgi:hypothetical protein